MSIVYHLKSELACIVVTGNTDRYLRYDMDAIIDEISNRVLGCHLSEVTHQHLEGLTRIGCAPVCKVPYRVSMS